LKVLKGHRARPTSARVREALFSILGSRIEACRFADLYTGTGTVGIEALSRGAQSCTFVERRHTVAKVLAANLYAVGAQDAATLRVASVETWIKEQWDTPSPYTVLFLDPPYKLGGIGTVLGSIVGARLIEPDGIVVLEHSSRTAPLQPPPGLELTRTQPYGDSALSFYHARVPG